MRRRLRGALLLACVLGAAGCQARDMLLVLHDGGADARPMCRTYPRDVGLEQGLLAYYPAEEASGAAGDVLADASGLGHDGQLMTGAGGKGGFTFGPGRVGNALYLNMSKEGYVLLPKGLLSQACEVTLAAWVNLGQMNAWMRIFDFGQNNNVYMFLTNNNNVNHVARFGITTKGNANEETVSASMPVPLMRWEHFAFVLGDGGGTLYIDGVAVGSNPDMTRRPYELGETTKNYIGRSQFPTDPYLDASVDELRVYDRALSADAIAALANIP